MRQNCILEKKKKKQMHVHTRVALALNNEHNTVEGIALVCSIYVLRLSRFFLSSQNHFLSLTNTVHFFFSIENLTTLSLFHSQTKDGAVAETHFALPSSHSQASSGSPPCQSFSSKPCNFSLSLFSFTRLRLFASALFRVFTFVVLVL